ncbi:SUKH-4 family immunity protein [Chitinophaga sp. CF118]|uniref:SUKH-4 family immunity protein n=1 Tax=Chitinophaga sp. CF118 TaxID=1884367 RepID=UPI000B7E105D|nr:SUKH-4 family immunity protein [Chitinophaga sp. CF118]
MTPQQFKCDWRNTDQPLSPISPERLIRFNILPFTNEFLTISGLPVYASPFLSFADDSTSIIDGINKLTEQFNFGNLQAEYEKYINIGLCRDGDPIVVNTSSNDQIEQLEHKNNFQSVFFNTSINHLANFLIIYRDFEDDIMREYGEEGIRNCYFTDAQFEILKKQMIEIDELALTGRGFWKEELEIILSLRKDYLESLKEQTEE